MIFDQYGNPLRDPRCSCDWIERMVPLHLRPHVQCLVHPTERKETP